MLTASPVPVPPSNRHDPLTFAHGPLTAACLGKQQEIKIGSLAPPNLEGDGVGGESALKQPASGSLVPPPNTNAIGGESARKQPASGSLGPPPNANGIAGGSLRARLDARRYMTETERDLYLAQVRASDGFDVDDFSWARDMYIIRAVPPGRKDEIAQYCAKLAVDRYNDEKGRVELQLLDIIKFNKRAASPKLYYLTLKVRNAADPEGKDLVYQAEVSFRFPRSRSVVETFRPKPEKPKPPLVFMRHPCGCDLPEGHPCTCTSSSEDDDSGPSSSGGHDVETRKKGKN